VNLLSPSHRDSCPVERAEDIEIATFWLEQFVVDVANGVCDHDPDILHMLARCSAVLWVTAGEHECEAKAPRLYRVLTGKKGVSFRQVAELIPPFLKKMTPLIDRRMDNEIRLRLRDLVVPLMDNELPF
jgi:hypothetical protein